MAADSSENNKSSKSSTGGLSSGALISANRQPSNLCYVDIATLSQQDQDIASAYISLLPQPLRKTLVPLGIYRGFLPQNNMPWDFRPVFLDPTRDNALLLLRIVQPGVKISERIISSWNNVPELLKNSYVSSGLGNCSILGDQQNVHWGLRRYCEYTLADTLDLPVLEILKRNSSTDCVNIISELSELETRLAPHGHITKTNIGILKNHLCLIDPWFYSICESPSSRRAVSDELEILSVQSFSSLFLNMFGSSLDQSLIAAFQACLTSEQQLTSFTELLKQIESSEPGSSLKRFNLSKHSTEDSVAVVMKSNETTILRDPNAISSSSSRNFGVAPAGRIILPQSTSNPTENRRESSEASINSGSPSLDHNHKAARASVLGIQLPDQNLQTKLLSNRGLMFFCVALFVAVIVMVSSKTLRFHPSNIEIQRMQEDWESNNPARLKLVAEAALDDADSYAQEIIEVDLLGGNSRPGVNPNFLKVAFNDLWREELTSKDKIFAFSITLAGLYRLPSEKLPPLDEVHPGVLLSLLGDMSLQAGQGKFDSISIDKLSMLPASYGKVFSGLQKLGIASFADISARAAARIVTGANDQESFDTFIDPNLAPEEVEKRLDLIAPFCEMYPELSKLMLTSLAGRSDDLAERVKWFVEDPIAQWNQVDENTLLYIVLGLVPESLQNFDRIVDLLQYPTAGVRDQAKSRLLIILGNPLYSNLLGLLTNKPSVLSRSQALGLLAATRVPAEKVGPFLASWLDSKPDPSVVLQLLLCTREQKSYESTFVQLANYLARSDFDVSIKDLPLLITHPEALARALVFSRLDASKIVDRKVLEAWLKTENSPRLKEQIQTMLNSTNQDMSDPAGAIPLQEKKAK